MDNRNQLKEGLLDKIVDNFFSALKRGVADNYIAAAEKAGVDPVIAASMKEMEKHNKIMAKLLKQNK